MLLQSQVVFVSGAAGGHGSEYSRGIVNEGGIVVANDIDEGKLAALKKELGDKCIVLPGDIREADRLIADAIKRAGKLDAIINNAGATQRTNLLESDSDTFDRIVGVNLKASFLACKTAVQYWIEQKRPGRIVNISSGTGLWPHSGQTIY